MLLLLMVSLAKCGVDLDFLILSYQVLRGPQGTLLEETLLVVLITLKEPNKGTGQGVGVEEDNTQDLRRCKFPLDNISLKFMRDFSNDSSCIMRQDKKLVLKGFTDLFY